MKKPFFNPQYKLSFFISIGIHLAILTFLVVNIFMMNHSSSSSAVKENQQIVQATAVDESTLKQQMQEIQTQREQKQQQEIAHQNQLKEEAQKLKQQRVEEEKKLKKLQEDHIAQQKEIFEKQKIAAIELEKINKQKQAEQERLDLLKQQKTVQEKQKETIQEKPKEKVVETKKKVSESKTFQENQKTLDAQKDAERIKKQQEIAKALIAQEAQAKAQFDSKLQGVINQYRGLITQAIAQHWIIPAHADRSLSCRLLIKLGDGGVVENVTLVQTSGDDALDRSAINAVYKASPLPVPAEGEYFAAFKELQLTVRPEGYL